MVAKLAQTLRSVFDRVSTYWLQFVVFFLAYASFKLYGNEEQYLVYAKQFAEPSWMSYSELIKDFPGARLFFQIMFGWTLKYITFEQLTFLGRILSYLLYAFPLSILFKRLKLSNIEILFGVVALWLPHQVLFAGGWIVEGFETKVFSYFFVLYALLALLDEKILKTAFFLGLATLFHVLVGGWITVVFFVYILIRHFQLKTILLGSAIWLVIVGPFIVYLASHLIGGEHVVNGVNTDWIYSYIRNPHHTALFRDWPFFIKKHLAGVLLTFLFLLVAIYLKYKVKDKLSQKLSLLHIVLFSQQLVFVIVAYFDTNGSILKLYPFRTCTISALLLIFQGMYLLKYHLNKPKVTAYKDYILLLLLVVGLGYLTKKTIHTYSNIMWERNTTLVDLYNYITKNTNNTDVFLIYNSKHSTLSFLRDTEREYFISRTFIPTESKAIYQWYIKTVAKNKVLEDITTLPSLVTNFKVDYLISSVVLSENNLKVVYRNENYYLYKIMQ